MNKLTYEIPFKDLISLLKKVLSPEIEKLLEKFRNAEIKVSSCLASGGRVDFRKFYKDLIRETNIENLPENIKKGFKEITETVMILEKSDLIE